MKFPVKKGQQIFIVQKDMLLGERGMTIVDRRETVEFEGIVTSVNSSSFYVRRLDSDDTDYRMRFNKRSGLGNGIIYYYEAYPDKETYDNIVKRIQRERELRADITKCINKLELEDLKKIKKILTKKILTDKGE